MSARALLVITFSSTLVAAGLTWAGSLLGAYIFLSRACMRASDAIRADTGVVGMAAAAGAALIVLVAMLSATVQLVRTRRMLAIFKDAKTAAPRALGTIAGRLGLAGRLDVAEVGEPLAFCYGLLRPRLMVSTGLVKLLDDDELEAVIRHEAAHLLHRDPLRIVVARSLSLALSFVPFSAGVRDAYLCARELRADRAAVSGMGDAFPLASALQRTLVSEASSDVRWLAVGALSATDVRIDHLLGRPTPPKRLLGGVHRLHALAFAVVVSVFVCAVVAIAHAATGVRPCLPC